MEDDEIKLTKYQFYFETSLYEKVSLANLEKDIFKGEFTGFNPLKHYKTTFTVQRTELARREQRSRTFSSVTAERSRSQFWEQSLIGFYAVVLTCKQNADQIMIFLHEDSESVTKIGQSPSLADIKFAEVADKYDKQLSKEDLKNYKMAIFGHAHGVGNGSFVYLRRIFENLITEAFNTRESAINVDFNAFSKLRMAEKIELLKGVLPSQLIEMKAVYGVLSKGVHELTEAECLKYFPAIKLSIELILDQKIEAKQKADKDAAVKSELQKITQAIGEKK